MHVSMSGEPRCKCRGIDFEMGERVIYRACSDGCSMSGSGHRHAGVSVSGDSLFFVMQRLIKPRIALAHRRLIFV